MKTNYKSLANSAWKESNFSLMGVVKYINKTTEKNLRAFLAENNCKAAEVTIDLIKAGAKPEKFFTHDKTGAITGDKKLFSLWFALTAIKEAKKAN
jgi:hypothetical protein